MSGQKKYNAQELIPHRLPMRLIDKVLAAVDSEGVQATTVEVLPREQHLFADASGALDTLTLLEMMAQGFAAVRGREQLGLNAPVRDGYLVGVRDFKVYGQPSAADTLHVHLFPEDSIGDFHLATAHVMRDGQLLAEAAIRVWAPEGEG